MMFRTVTFIAVCSWCSVRTISSAVVPWVGQTLIEPLQHDSHVGVNVAKTLNQLHDKGPGQGLLFELAQSGFGRNGGLSAGAERDCQRAASASSRSARLRTILSVSRRRFSTSTTRSVMATAHSSPISSGWTR